MRPAPTPLFALALALAGLVGCSLAQPRAAKEKDDPAPQGTLTPTSASGPAVEVFGPRRCTLRVAILSRTLGDASLNEELWGGADEQVLTPEARHALEANGLRLGIITGDLPASARAVLDAPPPHQVDPKTLMLPDGEASVVELRPTAAQVSLLLNLRGTTAGKDYHDARGAFRLTPTTVEGAGVRLRLVPEVDHGPITSRYAGAPTAGPFDSQQFIIKNGQEEETFADLAAAPTIRPDQVAVLGCLPGRRGSIGDFLMTEPEAGSDRLLQKVVLIWATAVAPSTTSNGPTPLLEALEAAAKGPARP